MYLCNTFFFALFLQCFKTLKTILSLSSLRKQSQAGFVPRAGVCQPTPYATVSFMPEHTCLCVCVSRCLLLVRGVEGKLVKSGEVPGASVPLDIQAVAQSGPTGRFLPTWLSLSPAFFGEF